MWGVQNGQRVQKVQIFSYKVSVSSGGSIQHGDLVNKRLLKGEHCNDMVTDVD